MELFICIIRIWHWITYNGWYPIKPNQPNNFHRWDPSRYLGVMLRGTLHSPRHPELEPLHQIQLRIILLYFGLWPGQKCHSKVMHRKEVTHSNGSYERKSRGRKLADEMGRGKKNSHGTLIDWCTRREWPVNCMTVISAWWRSIIPFQRSSWRLSGRWTII